LQRWAKPETSNNPQLKSLATRNCNLSNKWMHMVASMN
jgi:hypothetical protein